MTRYIGRDRGRNSRRIMISVAVLSIFLIVGYAWVELNGGWTAQLPSWLRPMPNLPRVTGPQSSGPSVPWPTMLALAEQEAANIDKDAIFSHGAAVRAAPPGRYEDITYPGPLTGSLELSFDYQRPNGGRFTIYFEDAAPQNTLRNIISDYVPSETGRAAFNPEHDARQRRILSQVKISPREALALTWSEAQAEAEKSGIQGATLDPLIIFDARYVLWSISYWLRRPAPTSSQGGQQATPMPTPATPTSELLMGFVVDAATGEITRRDYFMFATPTPIPSPTRTRVP